MGILEVHDGRNRVERVRLTRENPLLFGSNPMCDVVLTGEGVAPFHGRIRWSDRRFKVDAGADIGSIEVNGKKLRSSTLYQGDEIAIGPCRIFVISVEDPAARTEPEPDDHTRIIDTPKAVKDAPSSSPRGRTPAAEPPAPVAGGLEFGLDSFDVEELEDAPEPPAPASRRAGEFTPGEPLRRGPASRRAPVAQSEPAPEVDLGPVGPPPSFLDKFKRFLPATDGPPGEERVLSSPIVLGLAAVLVILLFGSVSLFRIIAKNNADKAYDRAVESVNEGDYTNAIARFDAFLASHASDPRAGKAQVLRGIASVRRFTGSTGASWTQALEAATKLVDDHGERDEFQDVANELGEQLIAVAEAEADQAKTLTEAEPLARVDSALALHARVLGESSAKFVEKSAVSRKVAEAKAAIEQARTRLEAIAAMTKGLADKQPQRVYEARDLLIRRYPQLLTDREVVSRLTQANDLIKQAAIADPANRPGLRDPRPDPLGPAVSFVLRSNPGVAATAGGPLVFALADGFVHAVDGGTGAPVWIAPVGLASPFTPIPIPGGEPSVIAFDSRHDELVKLDAKTGKLIWRQTLGERIDDPPLIIGTHLYQSTPSGRLLMIDLRSGNLLGSLDLGRPLTRTPVADESGEHLYVLGEEDCLFVLERNPLACRAVEYLGHGAGSIACAPARVGRFLVIPENMGMNEGRWRIVLLDEEGLSPRTVQSVPIAGWTWSTPRDIGSLLWSVSDRNEVAAFTVGLYDAPEPFKLLARINADNEPSGPAFAFGKTERELVVASGRTGRFELSTDSSKLSDAWTLGNIGSAIAPIQEVGKRLVLTHQAVKIPGVALRSIDPTNGRVDWQTILGAPFPVALRPASDGSSLATLGLSGEAIRIERASFETGGFVEGRIPAPGDFSLPPSGDLWLPIDGPPVIVPGESAPRLLVQRPDGYRPIDLPAPLRATPLVWAGAVFLPCNDGRAYLIDPQTGENTADPFVPPFDKAHPSVWKDPVALDGNALALIDEEGLLRRVILAPQPRPHLEITADQKLPATPAGELASTGGAVIVATSAGEIRSYSASDLAPVGKWTLEAPPAAGPISTGGYAFVADAAGNVLAFGADGNRLWQVKLRDPMAPVAPALQDGAVWFSTRTGGLEGRSLADGSARASMSLGVLPTAGVIDLGPLRLVPAGRGTLRRVVPEVVAGSATQGEAKP
ncbi:MAG: PQQ-binding-like beta-propeller repeat protein [Isosphaeraceae bacterium]|nr:PQQ-binding-like beta-propeller repeat protein [Isosphaeraceae bacterium]